MPRIPVDGYYHYRTNPNPDTVPWVITGAMKVNKVLTHDEVDTILKDKGLEPTKWQGENVLFSVRDGRLNENSTEDERYELLKGASLKLASVNADKLEGIQTNFDNMRLSETSKAIKAIAKTLGIDKLNLYNSDLDFNFGYSLKSIGASVSHQREYGGSYSDYVNTLSCIEELAQNAVPIEVHTDKKVGTAKANNDIDKVYVLVSAFVDNNGYVPVEMEVKTFIDGKNGLYMNVALNKSESGVVSDAIPANKVPSSAHLLLPDSNISISELFGNNNPETDKRFLKYVPDGFLSDEQKAAKQNALAQQAEEYKSATGIRYSLRNYDELTSREILADVLSGATVNKQEETMLDHYKKNIEDYNKKGRGRKSFGFPSRSATEPVKSEI